MPSVDTLVLVGIIVGSIALAVFLRRHGARGRRFAIAMTAGVYGVVLTTSMSAHIIDIVSRWYVGAGYRGELLRYDFRLYSLLLLGGILTACGIRLVRAAPGVSRSEAGAHWRAATAAALALAVVVPLVPIQSFFAVPLSAIGAVVLLVVARRPAPRDSAAAAGT